MIRNFVNLIILDFENINYTIKLVEFVMQMRNKELKDDLLLILDKFPESENSAKT